MTSPFANALANMAVAQDEHMGEQIRLAPKKRSDFGIIDDPERDTIELIGLVSMTDPSTVPVPGLETRVSYEEGTVSVRRHSLPDGYRIKKGDEVILLEWPEPNVFRVTAPVERLDRDRLTVKISPGTALP